MKIEKKADEISMLRKILTDLDHKIEDMIQKIEERKSTYNKAVSFLCATRISDPAKNLIFHGVDHLAPGWRLRNATSKARIAKNLAGK